MAMPEPNVDAPETPKSSLPDKPRNAHECSDWLIELRSRRLRDEQPGEGGEADLGRG